MEARWWKMVDPVNGVVWVGYGAAVPYGATVITEAEHDRILDQMRAVPVPPLEGWG